MLEHAEKLENCDITIKQNRVQISNIKTWQESLFSETFWLFWDTQASLRFLQILNIFYAKRTFCCDSVRTQASVNLLPALQCYQITRVRLQVINTDLYWLRPLLYTFKQKSPQMTFIDTIFHSGSYWTSLALGFWRCEYFWPSIRT